MSKSPLVSVLIPTKNAQQYCKEAVLSIINQLYHNFEILIIDDHSTDNTVKIIHNLRESNIRLYKNPGKGIVDALNFGIKLAQGKYLTRMDADDLSFPSRIKHQVSYLERHKDIGVLGTGIKIIGDTVREVKFPTSSAEIKYELLFENVLAHPSIMIRKSNIPANLLRYQRQYQNAEDYALWTQLINITNFANLGEVLLSYRHHSGQVSHAHVKSQDRLREKIQIELLKRIGVRQYNSLAHRNLRDQRTNLSRSSLVIVYHWILSIVNANNSSKILEPKDLTFRLGQRWFHMVLDSSRLSDIQKLSLISNKLTSSFLWRILISKSKKLLK